MNRNVITSRDVQTGRAATQDTARERLLKFVPIETIGAYTAIDAGFKTFQDGGQTIDDFVVWVVVLFLSGFTPLYLYRFQNVRRMTQLLVSLVAFGVYVLTIGGVFATQVIGIEPVVQLILLVLTGLVLLFFKPPEPLSNP